MKLIAYMEYKLACNWAKIRPFDYATFLKHSAEAHLEPGFWAEFLVMVK